MLAVRMYQKCINTLIPKIGNDGPLIAGLYFSMGNVYRNETNYDKA